MPTKTYTTLSPIPYNTLEVWYGEGDDETCASSFRPRRMRGKVKALFKPRQLDARVAGTMSVQLGQADCETCSYNPQMHEPVYLPLMRCRKVDCISTSMLIYSPTPAKTPKIAACPASCDLQTRQS
jgi:hypothetical protein